MTTNNKQPPRKESIAGVQEFHRALDWGSKIARELIGAKPGMLLGIPL